MIIFLNIETPYKWLVFGYKTLIEVIFCLLSNLLLCLSVPLFDIGTRIIVLWGCSIIMHHFFFVFSFYIIVVWLYYDRVMRMVWLSMILLTHLNIVNIVSYQYTNTKKPAYRYIIYNLFNIKVNHVITWQH